MEGREFLENDGWERVTEGNSQDMESEKSEITLKFAKGCVGEPFTAKDGNEYVQIKIPNKDPNDKSPWATFVARSNAVHDNKFGKGVWMKIPEEGYTTIRKDVEIEPDEDGTRRWEKLSEKVSNTELKEMVEFYKEQNRENIKEQANEPPKEKTQEAKKESVITKLSEKKKEAASKAKAPVKSPEKKKRAVI